MNMNLNRMAFFVGFFSVLAAAPAFANSATAQEADACQISIANNLRNNKSLQFVFADITPQDVRKVGREGVMANSGTFDKAELDEAMKNEKAEGYAPGFHLTYVAVAEADGTCSVLTVGIGD